MHGGIQEKYYDGLLNSLKYIICILYNSCKSENEKKIVLKYYLWLHF